jgi:hypothetical protein
VDLLDVLILVSSCRLTLVLTISKSLDAETNEERCGVFGWA